MSEVVIMKELIGKIFENIIVGKKEGLMSGSSDDENCMIFQSTEESYMFHHDRECCEEVYISQIDGDLRDLTHETIIQAEYVTNNKRDDDICESETWTFYKFATNSGSVTVRWVGKSNGYYSESVDMVKL